MTLLKELKFKTVHILNFDLSILSDYFTVTSYFVNRY